MMVLLKLFYVLLSFDMISAAPAIVFNEEFKPSDNRNIEQEKSDTSVFYHNYLQNVLNFLNESDDIKNKFKSLNLDDIKDGKIRNDIKFFPEKLREKLNLLKKEEFYRLRKMLEAKSNLENGHEVKRSYLREIAAQLDNKNPHTFKAEDITNLIKTATKAIENFDLQRHDEFKKYAMEKEIRREERLKKLNQLDRLKEEENYMKHQKEVAANIPKINPGSKEQLEHVWNEQDHLEGQKFNPKTFFKLHDFNDDGMWDLMEIEALLVKELQMLNNTSSVNYDPMTMDEERRHMREYVMESMDKNKDSLVSLDEFLHYSSNNFKNSNPKNLYKTVQQLLYENSFYTPEELQNYRYGIKMQEQEIIQKLRAFKSRSKTLNRLKMEFKDIRENAKEGQEGENQEYVTKVLLSKVAQIKKIQKTLNDLQEDLQAHSKDLAYMKQNIKKHEAGNKAAEKIKNQLDKLSPGEENLKATKDVREETDKLKQLLETNSLSDEKDDGTENDDRNEKMRYDGGHIRKEY